MTVPAGVCVYMFVCTLAHLEKFEFYVMCNIRISWYQNQCAACACVHIHTHTRVHTNITQMSGNAIIYIYTHLHTHIPEMSGNAISRPNIHIHIIYIYTHTYLKYLETQSHSP
jgi:hypothetical protein